MVVLLILFGLFVFIRIIQVYFFIKYINKKCNIYDWRCVDEDPMLMFEILEADYYINTEWSAYNFLFLKGPSPLSIFFSFKQLTIENIYGKEKAEKLNRHEIN
jgi:hypothetical protein